MSHTIVTILLTLLNALLYFYNFDILLNYKQCHQFCVSINVCQFLIHAFVGIPFKKLSTLSDIYKNIVI